MTSIGSLSARTRLLTEVMTLNRLVHPTSEHAMPAWIRRTAVADILGADFSTLSDEALYQNLTRLHPQRARVEQALVARERTLFNLDDTLYLYEADPQVSALEPTISKDLGQIPLLDRVASCGCAWVASDAAICHDLHSRDPQLRLTYRAIVDS